MKASALAGLAFDLGVAQWPLPRPREEALASEVAMKITGDMVRGFWWGYVAGVLAHTAFDWWLR